MATITAREMSRWGSRASPASWMACSKPSSANTTPAGSAAKTPCAPCGAKPPPAVKFEPWKARVIRTTTVSRGTAVFTTAVTELIPDISRTPRMLMRVKTSMRKVPITRPAVVRVPFGCRTCTRSWNQPMRSMYESVASTSIGEIRTERSQDIQPAVKPTSGPKAKKGKRAVPPAMGYVAPSSAWASASTASIVEASTQDTSEAGPAMTAVVRAPSSQPEPMIDPREMNISPQNPTARWR